MNLFAILLAPLREWQEQRPVLEFLHKVRNRAGASHRRGRQEQAAPPSKACGG